MASWSNHEKRREKRYPVDWLSVEIQKKKFRVDNINLSGLMLSFDGEIDLKSGDEIDLVLIEGGARLPLRGKVVWRSGDSNNLGIRFEWKSEGVRTLVQKIISSDERI